MINASNKSKKNKKADRAKSNIGTKPSESISPQFPPDHKRTLARRQGLGADRARTGRVADKTACGAKKTARSTWPEAAVTRFQCSGVGRDARPIRSGDSAGKDNRGPPGRRVGVGDPRNRRSTVSASWPRAHEHCAGARSVPP